MNDAHEGTTTRPHPKQCPLTALQAEPAAPCNPKTQARASLSTILKVCALAETTIAQDSPAFTPILVISMISDH